MKENILNEIEKIIRDLKMRKKIDFDYLVSDYEKRFGKKNFGRKVKILHQEEIEKLHKHPSDKELKLRRKLAKPEICI